MMVTPVREKGFIFLTTEDNLGLSVEYPHLQIAPYF
jgi:hypothetical protein